MKQKNLLSANLILAIISTVFFGSFFAANSVSASHTTAVCETNTMKSGTFCNWTDSNSWCGGNTLTCQLEPDAATTPPTAVANGSWNFCNSCSWTLTCNGGFTKCAASTTCVANQTCLAGQYFDACTNSCLGTVATLQLAYDSVGPTYLVNSASPVLSIGSAGNVGIGTTIPNDVFSIGMGGVSAPVGSLGTGHNNTMSYVSTDNYALVNYGTVKSIIASTTSNGLWGGTLNGNIWNGAAGLGNVGIGTITPSQKLDVAGNININTNGTNALFSTYKGANSNGNNLFIGGGGQSSIGGVGATYQGAYNTFVGIGAGNANTTGYQNSAQGYNSLFSNTTGFNNSAQGINSLYANTTGFNNSAQGASSLWKNTTGNYNSAQGINSLYANTTGSSNSAQGAHSLQNNTTGNYNSAQGYQSLLSNTTGNYNSAQGFQAGMFIADGTTLRTTGNNGLYLGAETRASANGTDNEIVIGYSAIGIGSNTAVLGNDSIVKTVLKGNVGIGTTAPNDIFSIGMGGVSAPSGSSGTGHNNTMSYVSTDQYALVNYGTVKSIIASSTGLWGGTLNGNIWNGTAGLGNVGIGTTNPGYKLQVQQTSTSSPAMMIGGGYYGYPRLQIYGLDSDPFAYMGFGTDMGGGPYELSMYTSNKAGMGKITFGTYNGSIYNQKMVMDNVGNLGIGITNPAQKLNIAGGSGNSDTVATQIEGLNGAASELILKAGDATYNRRSAIRFYSNQISSSAAQWVIGSSMAQTAGDSGFYFNDSSNSNSLFLKQGGNVGIGTTNPGAKLEVNGDILIQSGNKIGFRYSPSDANSYGYISMAAGAAPLIITGGMYSSSPTFEAIRFSTQNVVAAMSILNNGNVGIGTTAPNDVFSIGVAGASAPVGMAGTGHNYVNNYTGADSYALVNYGFVVSAINGAISASSTSRFVGLSAVAYNGNNNANNGYTYAYARCAADQAGAHVCTPDEILNTIAKGGTMPAEDAWIFAGPPGYTAAANDCEGRSIATTAARGTYWQKAATGRPDGRGLLMLCDQSLKLACCR